MTRVSDYGRMLASIGINGCAINNVNADPRILTPDFIPQVARIADALRPWGVQVVARGRLRQPEENRRAGHIRSAGSAESSNGGRAKADEIYRAIPDIGGFVLKADSEGRVGPVGVRPNARGCRERAWRGR